MRSCTARILLACVAVLAAAPAFASPITISESGTFAAGTPVTAYTTPGGNFSYSFTIDSNPVIPAANVQPGIFFIAPITNFQYTLNGSAVALTPRVDIFTSDWQGLFNLCFDSSCAGDSLEFEGVQLYTGTQLDPTIVTGTFTPQVAAFVSGTTEIDLASASDVTAVPLAVTPEPSSLVLAGSGLLGAMGVLRRRRRSA